MLVSRLIIIPLALKAIDLIHRMLRFLSTYLLCALASLIINCTASPFLSAAVQSSGHGGLHPPFQTIALGQGGDRKEDVSETQILVRTIPGYSSDGRCGPAHGGLMCDPDSTVYIVSREAPDL